MRIEQADIGHSGEAHKLLLEYLSDTKNSFVPLPDYWLHNFTDQKFFCLIARHGRTTVGMTWGRVHPYYTDRVVEVEGIFVKRGFRKKIKFVRRLSLALKDYLRENGVGRAFYKSSTKILEV